MNLERTPRRFGRRKFLIGAGGLGLGLAVGGGVWMVARTFSSENLSGLREINEGEEIKPQTLARGLQSGITKPQYRILTTSEDFQAVWNTIYKTNTGQGQVSPYPYDAKKEVAVVFALGKQYLKAYESEIIRAVEKEGKMVVEAEYTEPRLPVSPLIERGYSAPSHLALFPRVTMNGSILPWELAKPKLISVQANTW